MVEILELPWRVLLVDDDDDEYLIVNALLKDAPGEKIHLEWASNFQDAKQKLLTDEYHAILIDYDLGDRSGLDLINIGVENRCRAALILYTGRGSYATEIEAMETGATLYLIKSEATPLLLKRTLRYAIERKRLEQEIERRARERLEILESIQDGLFTINRAWHITYINQRAAQTADQKPEELIGVNLWEAFPRLLGTPLEKIYRTAMKKGTPAHLETPGVYQGLWYSVNIYPSAEGISIFWQDITERKQRELNAAFLDDLGRALSDLSTPEDMMSAAGEKIKQHFGAIRLTFLLVDEATDTITGVYDNMEPELINAKRIGRLSEYIIAEWLEQMRSGQVIAIEDVFNEPRIAAFGEFYRRWNIGSQLVAPAVQEGKLRFVVVMQLSEPHRWRDDEIELVKALVERLYPRLEKGYTEESQRLKEDRYRRLFDTFEEGLLVAEVLFDDAERPVDIRLLEANRTAAQLMPTPEFSGRLLSEIDPIGDAERLAVWGRVALSGTSERFERYDPRLNRFFDVHLFRLDAEHHRVAAVFNDITARKQTEHILQESEQRFRTMADGTPVLIWVTDVNGKMEFINRAYSEYFGQDIDTIKHKGWQPLIHPDDGEYVRLYLECLERQQRFEAEARVRRSDGVLRRIYSVGQPRFSTSGEFLGMAGSSVDITVFRDER